VLGKDCYAEAQDWKQCLSPHSQILTVPKPGQAQHGVYEALVPLPLALGRTLPRLCLFLLILAKWPLSKADPWESRTAWYLHTKDPCCPKLVSPPRRAPSLKGCNPPMQWLRRKKRHKATGMRQTSQQQTRNITNPVPVPAAPDLIVYWKF